MIRKQRTDRCRTSPVLPASVPASAGPVRTQVRLRPASAQNPPWRPPPAEKPRHRGSCRPGPALPPALLRAAPQGLCSESSSRSLKAASSCWLPPSTYRSLLSCSLLSDGSLTHLWILKPPAHPTSSPTLFLSVALVLSNTRCVRVCLCTCMYARVRGLSHVQLFVTPWIIARRAPLSMEFSRQNYWSGLLFPLTGSSRPED